jgi:Zn-dependent peptidase ImmA (M78 family)
METETLLATCLYSTDKKKFDSIEKMANRFSDTYVGEFRQVKDHIFEVIRNYARIAKLELEVIRFPSEDAHLWGCFFSASDHDFLYINSTNSLEKQNFAAAHELYHVLMNENRYAKKVFSDVVTGNGEINNEDLEASAFAALLLVPTKALQDCLAILLSEKTTITSASIQLLNKYFMVPEKSLAMRLYEIGRINRESLLDLFSSLPKSQVIPPTECAVELGSLVENMQYAKDLELVDDEDLVADEAFLESLKP